MREFAAGKADVRLAAKNAMTDAFVSVLKRLLTGSDSGNAANTDAPIWPDTKCKSTCGNARLPAYFLSSYGRWRPFTRVQTLSNAAFGTSLQVGVAPVTSICCTHRRRQYDWGRSRIEASAIYCV